MRTFFFICLGLVLSTSAQAATLLNELGDPSADTFGNFGHAVATDGEFVVVADVSDNDTGQIYVYSAETGDLIRTLNDPSPAVNGLFGQSVAIDNGRIVVGASNNGSQTQNSGRAYLFDAASGTLLQSFDRPDAPTGTTRDSFGLSVDIEGDQVVVGAPFADVAGNSSSGEVFVFDATSGDLTARFQDPNSTYFDNFGYRVQISDNHLLVSDDSRPNLTSSIGDVYLFDLATEELVNTFTDPTTTSSDLFGFSLAFDGQNVIVGAPSDDSFGGNVGQVYHFDAFSGALLNTFDDPTVTSGNFFGATLSLDDDNLLIGARAGQLGGSTVGQAFLFDLASGDLTDTLFEPGMSSSFQNTAVAISGDTIVVGADSVSGGAFVSGRAFLFQADPEITPVPLPASGFLLFASGLGLLAFRRKPRQV